MAHGLQLSKAACGAGVDRSISSLPILLSLLEISRRTRRLASRSWQMGNQAYSESYAYNSNEGSLAIDM